MDFTIKTKQEANLGVVLVGFGYWGKNLSRVIAVAKQCSLKAIIDSDPKARELAKELYPNLEIANNVEAVLTESDIDIVVIATPVSTHVSIIKKCLTAGKHVLCEKIISNNEEEVIALFDLAKSEKLILKEGFTFLHNKAVEYVKQAIYDKSFGKIYYCTFKRTGLGPYRSDVNVLYDLAPHDLSMLIYWFGQPAWVSGISRCIINENIADVVFFQLGYTNEMIVNIQVSWINPMKQRVVEIIGEKQMLIFDDVSNTERIKIIKTGDDYNKNISDFGSFQLSVKDGDIIIPNIVYTEPLKIEFDSFIEQVRVGQHDEKDAEMSIAVVRTLTAISKSLNNESQKIDV